MTRSESDIFTDAFLQYTELRQELGILEDTIVISQSDVHTLQKFTPGMWVRESGLATAQATLSAAQEKRPIIETAVRDLWRETSERFAGRVATVNILGRQDLDYPITGTGFRRTIEGTISKLPILGEHNVGFDIQRSKFSRLRRREVTTDHSVFMVHYHSRTPLVRVDFLN